MRNVVIVEIPCFRVSCGIARRFIVRLPFLFNTTKNDDREKVPLTPHIDRNKGTLRSMISGRERSRGEFSTPHHTAVIHILAKASGNGIDAAHLGIGRVV